jgi:hypothetical protein
VNAQFGLVLWNLKKDLISVGCDGSLVVMHNPCKQPSCLCSFPTHAFNHFGSLYVPVYSVLPVFQEWLVFVSCFPNTCL